MQRLLLGTHTSDNEQNYVMLADVQLPLEDAEIDSRQYEDEKAETGGCGASAGKVCHAALALTGLHLDMSLLWQGFVLASSRRIYSRGALEVSSGELARTLLSVRATLKASSIRPRHCLLVEHCRSKSCSKSTTMER